LITEELSIANVNNNNNNNGSFKTFPLTVKVKFSLSFEKLPTMAI